MDTGFPTPLNYLNAQQVTIAEKQKTNKILNTHLIGTRIMDKRKVHIVKRKTLSRLRRNNRTPGLST